MMATLKNLLETALLPLGNTMYVYGGGWNSEDSGAENLLHSSHALSVWKRFFEAQDAAYDFRNHLYERKNGLDCSGYVGWVLNCVLEKNSVEDCVMKAAVMAQTFAARGWGHFISRRDVCEHRIGDVMSTEGHVYFSLGECADGSVLLLHASPPGVTISGTVTPRGSRESNAATLAERIMSKYYPRWHERYPFYVKGISYLTDYDGMRWFFDGKGVLTDADGYGIMSAEAWASEFYPEGSFEQ